MITLQQVKWKILSECWNRDINRYTQKNKQKDMNLMGSWKSVLCINIYSLIYFYSHWYPFKTNNAMRTYKASRLYIPIPIYRKKSWIKHESSKAYLCIIHKKNIWSSIPKIHTHNIHTCIHTHTYTYAYSTHTHTIYMHIYNTHMHIHAHTYTQTYIHNTDVYLHTCITYIHTWACTHI